MNIHIFGSESLGVRGLSCSVELKNRTLFIDPGIALGWSRYGFLPHPFQVAVGAGIQQNIIKKLKSASDVIISHFDGDHCPLSDANPYQLKLDAVKHWLSHCRIWAKGPDNASPAQLKRRKEMAEAVNQELPPAEGMKDGPLAFSLLVPHGIKGDKKNTVMMSRVEEDGVVFVHASDIQFLEAATIEKILDWKADIVLASGPALYRSDSLSSALQMQHAWHNALKLACNVGTLIIDHHLFRSEEGIDWLAKLRHRTKRNVLSAADFMKRQPVFLEAWRKELYEWLPVSMQWHEDYRQGKVTADGFRKTGWAALIARGKIQPCKWYSICPIKTYTEKGKLDSYWTENYCLVANRSCLRYQMEETGQYHPDNMLPNGDIRKDL